MIDKLLFLLLLILLPLGLIVAKFTLDARNNPGTFTPNQEERINEAIKKLEETVAAPENSTPQFTITSTLIATEAGEFRISGIAPYEDSVLIIKLFKKPLVSDEEVIMVEQIVQPATDGSFIMTYEYAAEDDVLEVWIQQQDAIYVSTESISDLIPQPQ